MKFNNINTATPKIPSKDNIPNLHRKDKTRFSSSLTFCSLVPRNKAIPKNPVSAAIKMISVKFTILSIVIMNDRKMFV